MGRSRPKCLREQYLPAKASRWIVSQDQSLKAVNTSLDDCDYLRMGTPRQRLAHQVLTELGLPGLLARYHPVLCGTIPIDVDIESSDLDLICYAADPDQFALETGDCFRTMADFESHIVIRDDLPTAIVRFRHPAFAIELFAQGRPVHEQRAYRHMLIEARILELGGEPARTAIRELKRSGLKTEPAFAAYLNLSGDPYLTLLELQALDDTALRQYLSGR